MKKIILILILASLTFGWKTPPPIPIGIYGFSDFYPTNISILSKSLSITVPTQDFGYFQAQIPWDDPETQEKEGISINGEELIFEINGRTVLKRSFDMRDAGMFIELNLKYQDKVTDNKTHPNPSGRNQATTNKTIEKTLENISEEEIPQKPNISEILIMPEEEKVKHIEDISEEIPVFPLPTPETVKNIQQKEPSYEKASPDSYKLLLLLIYILIIAIIIYLKYKDLKNKEDSEEL